MTQPASIPTSSQRTPDDLDKLVQTVEGQDASISEAMRLFEITSEIYQQALLALNPVEECTGASTACYSKTTA